MKENPGIQAKRMHRARIRELHARSSLFGLLHYSQPLLPHTSKQHEHSTLYILIFELCSETQLHCQK